jgi:hypothetical protein
MSATADTCGATGTRESGVTELRVGEFRRHVRLGTAAVYRVCAWTEALVQVEVDRAPGLQAGQRFTFDRAIVDAMEIVPAPERRSERSEGR